MNVQRVVRWCGAAAVMGALLAGARVAHAQNAVVSGQVSSELGEPLEGANVYIQELSLSTVSNAAGRFTITIPAARATGQTAMLRVRFIGHVPQARQITLAAGQTQTQNFSLKVDVNRLSEVVVTGVTAGTEQAKVPFTVSKVDVADLPVPAANPLSQIQGKVPGAQIVSASGRPGSSPSIILRGPTSINASGRGQEPLYIVDGVIINGSLPDINPLDIESIEVVKGAAAASLYGARAGNGVVQITTKSGKSLPEGVKFNVRTEYGVSDIEGRFPLAQTHSMWTDETGQLFCQGSVTNLCAQVFDYHKEAARINDAPGDFALSPKTFPVDPGSSTLANALRSQFNVQPWPGQTYDAVRDVVDPQPFAQTNVDMTARFGETNVFASVSYLDQGGAIRFLDGYKRSSARVNVDQQFGEKWNLALRTYYTRSDQDGLNQEGGGQAFFRLTRVPAIANVLQTDALGRLYVRPNLQGSGQQNENPLSTLSGIDRSDRTDRFIGGGTLRYQPFTWLDVEGNFSYDGQRLKYEQFQDKGFRTTSAGFTGYIGSIFQGSDNSDSYNGSVNATLRHDFGSDLSSRVSLRYLYEQQDFDRRTLNGNTLAVQGITAPTNATANQSIGGFSQSVRQSGLFGGVNLEYKERYIVDALVRRDGSSLFGSDQRWSTFGRGSVAWRASQEPWWPIPALNEFKLRASYGTAGGRPAFVAQYETFTVGTGGVLQPIQLGNSNLKPEKIHEQELGIDAELFNRLGLNVTYAKAESKDQILPVPQSAGTGFSTQWRNAGSLEGKTWEVSANMPIITKRDFTWSTRVNYDRNRTIIKKLNVLPFTFGVNQQAATDIFRAREGERFGTFYGRSFITSCGDLPTQFQSQCGDGRAFQRNDDGFIVWVGEGNSWRDGITNNLWQAQLPGCVNSSGSAVACTTPGRILNSPTGVALNWGMPIVLRDTLGSPQQVALGHSLPDYQLSLSNSVTFKRFSLYGLVQGAFGQSVWNQGRQWSYLDFLNRDVDQVGKGVDRSKPIGYYWRVTESGGLGGLYDVLGPTSVTTEDASYMKLREASLSYRVGALGGFGDWTVSVVGRNLKTWTDYSGFDPEVGFAGGQSGSAVINAIDAYTFPNLRSWTFSVSTSF